MKTAASPEFRAQLVARRARTHTAAVLAGVKSDPAVDAALATGLPLHNLAGHALAPCLCGTVVYGGLCSDCRPRA